MTPGILLLIGIILLIVGAIGAVLNFFINGKKFINAPIDGSGFGKSAMNMMLVHVVCAILCFSGMLSLIGGGIWFIIEAVNKSA